MNKSFLVKIKEIFINIKNLLMTFIYWEKEKISIWILKVLLISFSILGIIILYKVILFVIPILLFIMILLSDRIENIFNHFFNNVCSTTNAETDVFLQNNICASTFFNTIKNYAIIFNVIRPKSITEIFPDVTLSSNPMSINGLKFFRFILKLEDENKKMDFSRLADTLNILIAQKLQNGEIENIPFPFYDGFSSIQVLKISLDVFNPSFCAFDIMFIDTPDKSSYIANLQQKNRSSIMLPQWMRSFKLDSHIKIAIDNDIYEIGVSQYLFWNFEKYPHIAIAGGTGSGKTYFSKLLLARIGLQIEHSEIILCDFKADLDFSFALNTPNFYRFNECMNGLNSVVDLLQQRQQASTEDRHPVFFFFDEWASFLNSIDKKSADLAKQKLSLLLMLGRSFGIHVILSQQRLDAVYFGSARDNFSVLIGLGKLSKEMVEMMFSEYKEVIERNKPRGKGSAIIGNQFYNICVPMIGNIEKLHRTILKGLRYQE